MIQALSVAGVVFHQTAARKLVKAIGLIGVAAPRRVVRVRPQAHGGIDDTTFLGPQPITLEGFTAGSSDAVAQSEYRAISAALASTLPDGALITWTEPDGLALQMLVKLTGESAPVYAPGAHRLDYQASLEAADPRRYSQSLVTATGVALSLTVGGRAYLMRYNYTYSLSSGGTVTVTVGGTRPTPPIYRIYGMVQDPQILNLATGQRIVLVGTVNAGDYLELDVSAKTIKLNGVTPRANMLDPSLTQWVDLPVGVSNLQLIAASFDASARLDVLTRAVYS